MIYPASCVCVGETQNYYITDSSGEPTIGATMGNPEDSNCCVTIVRQTVGLCAVLKIGLRN